MIEELQPERSTNHAPVFQVLFNMLNYSDDEFQLPGLSTQDFYRPEPLSKFDLTLYAKEHHSAIHFKLVYNTELFDQPRMRELLDQLELLLSQIVKNPAAAIDSFSLMTQRFEEILPRPEQKFTTNSQAAVHEIVSQHAQRTPDQVAVADPYKSWTYADLDGHSNQLANCLIAHGIRRHDVVAIFGDRCASLVWAMLGVLKAGAAFLILDPNYPSSRLTEYLRIAQPRGWLHILTAGEPPAALSEFIVQRQFCCHLEIGRRLAAHKSAISPASNDLRSSLSTLIEDYPSDAPQIHVSSTDLAYVTFTSGTTGVPRGVGGTHDSLTHYPGWLKQAFGIDYSDRFSMLSGLSHDPLLRDVFSPLQLGAMLCIPDQDDIQTPGKLAHWMLQERISVANMTPAMGQIVTGGPSDARRQLDLFVMLFSLANV